MKRVLLVLTLLTLLAAPSWAGWVNCTAAMVTAGMCRSTNDVLFYIAMSPAARAEIGDALQYQTANVPVPAWQATVTCTQAMVDVGTVPGCDLAHLGQQVTNPMTQQQYVTLVVKQWIIGQVISYRQAKAANDARIAASTTPPDVP